MPGRLNIGWIWVGLYSIAGSLTLAHLFSEFVLHTGHLFSLGAGGFIGAALVSRFADGRALRECLLAAVMVVVGVAILMSLTYVSERLRLQASYGEFLSALAVMTAAAMGGSRVGALWADRAAYQGTTAMGALMSAIVLVGAFACHVGLIALLEDASHRLGILFIILSVVMTPSFAGAALQLGQADPVEKQMAYGLTLISAAFLALIGWELQSVGTAIFLSLAFLGVGALIYSVSLPGVLTVRSSGFWSHRCNDVPVAVATLVKEVE